MFIPRVLEETLLKVSTFFPVILVTGARQVGKTTLLKYLADKEKAPERYVSLDEFGPRTLALEDPDLFLERYPPPVIIDEIQYAPGLLEKIKVLVDREQRSGLFWLTGSQHFSLMKGISESLAGRVGILKLFGLSQEEEFRVFRPGPFLPEKALDNPVITLKPLEVFGRLVRGTFPALALSPNPPLEIFYASYLQTYIERDVRLVSNISKLLEFEKFLRLCAARIGQLLNFSDLARDAGVSVSTAKEWLNILVASHQVFLLPPYYANLSKRQIKTPKLYFLDTGLAAYLAGWRSPEVAFEGAMAGALFENYVLSEILKSYFHRGKEPAIYFWRTKEGQEVDFLLEEGGKIYPVEAKLTMRPKKDMLRGLYALRRRSKNLGPGALICLVERPLPLEKDIFALPLGAL
ncbi:ATP-binding protein [Thermodesulfatator atlanticus]